MTHRIRRVFLIVLAFALSTAACVGPPKPPVSGMAPAPVTAPPLDVSRYLATPCAGVPAELAARLGLPEREDVHETVLVGAGDQAQCQLSSGPPLSAAAEVRFYPRARPLPLLTGRGSQVESISIDGYPAGEWVLSTGTDGSFTSCQVIVDIADSEGVGTLFNGASGQPITTSCANAKDLAAGIIANLRL